MRKIKPDELKQRACSYERDTPTPLDDQLRRAVQVGAVSTLAAIPVGLFFVPVLASWAYAGFFWFLGDLSVGLLDLLRSPLGLGYNAVLLLGFGLVWYMTGGLRQAPWAWHQTAFGLALAGAVDLVIMSLPVLLVVSNIVVWILIVILVTGLVLLVLSVLLGFAR